MLNAAPIPGTRNLCQWPAPPHRLRPAPHRAEALLTSFAAAGYQPAQPSILQPAEPFLDLSGEDIRKSLYLTTDASGDELCLRPDLTIPVARDYLASSAAGRPAGFCYLGPVFRYRPDRPSEFVQAGVESFGRRDIAAADAEMLALGLEATAAFGITDVGDPHRRRRPVRSADRRARSCAGVEAAADEGLQPQDQPGAGPAAHDAGDQREPHRLSRRAGGACRLRSQGGAGAGLGPDLDRGRDQPLRPQQRRDRRPLSRAVDHGRRRAAEGNRRGDRALPGDLRRSGRSTGAAARARRRRKAEDFRQHRPARAADRLHGRARPRHSGDPLRDLVRPRRRLLHRLRVRAARQRATAPNRWSRAAATTAC